MIRFLIEMLLKESELTFFFLEILSALNFIVLQNRAELSEVNCRDKPAVVSLCTYVSFELSEVYIVLFASLDNMCTKLVNKIEIIENYLNYFTKKIIPKHDSQLSAYLFVFLKVLECVRNLVRDILRTPCRQ